MNHKYSEEKARTILRALGIGQHYRGYQVVICSLDYISKDISCLGAMMKEICIPVSENMGCNTATVEVNIRRISEHSWKNNPELLQSISPRHLTKRPAAQQFLEILYYACCK